MAFYPVMPQLQNLSRDVQGHAFPSVGSREVRAHDRAACPGCPKHEAHGRPCAAIAARMLPGDTRAALVPDAVRIDADYLDHGASYSFRAGHVCNGMPLSDVLYNLGLGQATNVSDFVRYRIVSVASNPRVLVLEGPDPRSIGFLVSRTNPEWLPLPADQQTEPRLLFENGTHRLGAGALVRFEFPSTYAGRYNPYIEHVWPPTGPVTDAPRTFSVQLSRGAPNAKVPWDLAFPAEDYFLRVYSYGASPEGYPRHEPSAEELFERLEVSVGVGDVVDGRLRLRDADGDDAPVMMRYPAPTVSVRGMDADGNVQALVGALEVRDEGVGQWVSELVLGSVPPGIETLEVTYFVRAVATSEAPLPSALRCANSVRGHGGHEDQAGFCCDAPECDRFRGGGFGGARCWDPVASHFRFPDAREDASARADSATRFWQSEPLVLRQGATGSEQGTAASSHRNFAFDRPSGGVASIGSLCGGFWWRDLVGTKLRKSSSWFGPSLGQRVTFTDQDGKPWHRLSFGFFGNDAGGTPATGITGWTARKDQRGATVAGVGAVYPTHRGPSCGLAGFDLSADPAADIRLTRDPERLHATGRAPGVDVVLRAQIARFLP